MNPCFHCLSTISVLWLFLTVTWVSLRCVIVVLPDHIRFLLSVNSSEFGAYRMIVQKRMDQARRHICALLPEPLKISLKRWDVD